MYDEFCRNKKHRSPLSRPRRHENEEVVKSGLALTPTEMDKMVKNGIPITPQNLGLTYEEGYDKQNFDVSPEYRRGADIGELWEKQQSVNKRFRDSVNKLKVEQSKGAE